MAELNQLLNEEYKQKAEGKGFIADVKIEWYIELFQILKKELQKFQRLLDQSLGIKPKYKEFDVDRLKEIQIRELIGEPIRVSGNRASYRCPIHEEKTPSFVVYLKQNSWHCFGACNKGGSVIDLQMALYGQDFVQACQELNKNYM